MPLSSKISAGRLRHRITIVQPNNAQDSMGGVSQNPAQWQPVLTCWASIDALAGKDVHATESFLEVTSHRIEIRNPRNGTGDPNSPITNQMMVWYATRTFQIVAALNPDERNKKLILMCTEINQSNQQVATTVAA